MITNKDEVENVFKQGLKEIRALEEECEIHQRFFSDNELVVKEKVKTIVEKR